MCGDGGWETYVMIGVVLLLVVVYMVFTTFRNKKKNLEMTELKNKMAPGEKVRTAGGIVGVVHEIDRVEGTITVLTGGSTVKFAMDVVYPVEYFNRYSKSAEKKPVEEVNAEDKPNELISSENLDTINADFLDAPRDETVESKPKAAKKPKKSADDTAKFE